MKLSIKLISLALALLIALACIGCTGDGETNESTGGASTTDTSSAGTDSTAEGTETLETTVTTGGSTEATKPGVETTKDTETSKKEDEEKLNEITTIEDKTETPTIIAITVNGEAIKNFTICSDLIGTVLANDLAGFVQKITESKPTVAATATDKCVKFVVDSSLENTTKLTVSGKVITVSIPNDSDTNKVRGYEHFKSYIDADVNLTLTDDTDTREYTTLPYEEVEKASKTYLRGETEKDPLSYAAGETITFKISYMNGNQVVSCPMIKYTIQKDNGKSESGWAPCVDGVATVSTKINCAGFVRITAKATKINSAEISGVTQFNGGAAANAKDITTVVSEPTDFDDFWYDAIDELLEIAPEIVSMNLIEDAGTYKIYDVKIKAVDDSHVYSDGQKHDYVSGILTVPVTKNAKSKNIIVNFHGYGVTKSNIERTAGAITFNVIAHSIDANGSGTYYSNLNNGDLRNYGFSNNTDRDKVYYKNMILRDLQALRWVVEYFGPSGENLWNGRNITIAGPSQGGFQAVAVTALASNVGVTVNKLTADVPWMCDIGRTQSNRINSHFLPQYTTALRYYDTVNFAARITSGTVTVKVGLVDQTSRPTGVIALYNALGVTNKTLTYIQNGDHDYWAHTDITKSYTTTGDLK